MGKAARSRPAVVTGVVLQDRDPAVLGGCSWCGGLDLERRTAYRLAGRPGLRKMRARGVCGVRQVDTAAPSGRSDPHSLVEVESPPGFEGPPGGAAEDVTSGDLADVALRHAKSCGIDLDPLERVAGERKPSD